MNNNFNYIDKQFCMHGISLKLKELGFNEECLAYYHNHVEPYLVKNGNFTKNSEQNLYYDDCTAPLWQQVIDWFRDDKKINIEITRFPNINKWGFVTTDMTIIPKYLSGDETIKYNNLVTSPNRYDTYEEARIDAILHAIKFYLNKNGKS